MHFDMDSEDARDPRRARRRRPARPADDPRCAAAQRHRRGRRGHERPRGGRAAGFYRPDAVVMDVKLPVMDGMEATRVIHERSPATCIVLLGERARRRARAAGAARRRRGLPLQGRRARRAARACCAAPIEGEAAISRRLAMTLIESYRRAPRGGSGFRPVRSDAHRPRVGGPRPRSRRAPGRRTSRARSCSPPRPCARTSRTSTASSACARARRRPRRPAACASSCSSARP